MKKGLARGRDGMTTIQRKQNEGIWRQVAPRGWSRVWVREIAGDERKG